MSSTHFYFIVINGLFAMAFGLLTPIAAIPSAAVAFAVATDAICEAIKARP